MPSVQPLRPTVSPKIRVPVQTFQQMRQQAGIIRIRYDKSIDAVMYLTGNSRESRRNHWQPAPHGLRGW